jgi:hypothetical protein
MVCRNSDLSSVLITLARGASGVEDNQAVAMNHALIREGQSLPATSQEEWDSFINQTRAQFLSGRLAILPGSRDPIDRLNRALTQTPDAARLHAARNLIARAQRAQQAQTTYLSNYARELGVDIASAAMEFQVFFETATDNARIAASPAFVTAWTSNPDHTNLMPDRRSRYAYEQMEIGRATRLLGQNAPVEAPVADTLTRHYLSSSFLSEVGYDARSGRLEVIFTQTPERVYSYRIAPEVYNEFINSHSPGAYYSRNIRNNPDARYDDDEEINRASSVEHCVTCGQFVGNDMHYCPTMGSAEEINQEVRIAQEAAIAHVSGLTSDSASEALAPVRIAQRRSQRYESEYAGGTIHMRMPGRGRVASEARISNRLTMPVLATFQGSDEASVSGLALVAYNGRGLGYGVSPVLAPGDSGTDQMRCSCGRYSQTNNCGHINLVVSRIHSIINREEQATAAQATEAISNITPALVAANQASLVASTAAVSGWKPLGISFLENPEEFQAVYDEARLKRKEYLAAVNAGEDLSSLEYPVPYIKENAFNGLARRGSGRGFGIEIEWSFPGDWDRTEFDDASDKIGRELYSLGLTRSPSQAGYGESHNRRVYPDQHAKGWSYEQDDSTGSYPGYTNDSDPYTKGGELVSPIMYDEPETWSNLEKVCEVIKKHGGIPTPNAGLHVHVGVGDYDHRIANHNRALQAYAVSEDILFRMGTNPERRVHRDDGTYCRPNDLASSPYINIASAKNSGDHYNALNLEHIKGETRDHVEYRIFDGTINPAVIQAQAAMAVLLAESPMHNTGTTTPDEGREPRGTHIYNNPGRTALTGEDWLKSSKSFRGWLDRFVPGTDGDEKENPLVKQLVSLFAITRWQS